MQDLRSSVKLPSICRASKNAQREVGGLKQAVQPARAQGPGKNNGYRLENNYEEKDLQWRLWQRMDNGDLQGRDG